MKRNFAEFIATFAMVLFATGAGIVSQEFPGYISHLGISVIVGGIITAMIYVFGKISGAHMNPVVTLVLWTDKHLTWKHATGYIISQFVGAVLASYALHLLFPSNELLSGTYPVGSDMQSWILECILTFILVMVVFRFVDSKNHKYANWAGRVIGLVVLLEVYFAGPICGASMNPFRSLAPALVSGNLSQQWIYLTAPVVGGFAALLADKVVRSK